MKESDLLISHRDGVYSVKVSGRANFEYAVPLRELAKTLDATFKCVQLDMTNCTAMDSTFMGVLSMIALKARKNNAAVELLNAADHLKKLLRDLGVFKLFVFSAASDDAGTETTQWSAPEKNNSLLTAAETVTEAHEVLVEADEANAARFDQVIEFARKDVERLKKDQ